MSSFTLAVDVWIDKVLFECDGSLPESFIIVIMSATALSHCTDCSSSLAMSSAWSKRDTRRTRPILRLVTFLVAFGVVLVAPHTGWCILVDVPDLRRTRPIFSPVTFCGIWCRP